MIYSQRSLDGSWKLMSLAALKYRVSEVHLFLQFGETKVNHTHIPHVSPCALS